MMWSTSRTLRSCALSDQYMDQRWWVWPFTSPLFFDFMAGALLDWWCPNSWMVYTGKHWKTKKSKKNMNWMIWENPHFRKPPCGQRQMHQRNLSLYEGADLCDHRESGLVNWLIIFVGLQISALWLRKLNINWLVVGPPLWKIWKLIGMIRNPIYGKIKIATKPPTKYDHDW